MLTAWVIFKEVLFFCCCARFILSCFPSDPSVDFHFLIDRMSRNQSLGSIHVILLWIVDRYALTVMASAPPEESTQTLPVPGRVILTTTAAFSTFSTTRPLSLIVMNNTIIDNQGSSSSIQPSGTPTTSSNDASSSSTSASPTSDLAAVGRLPSAGPMTAGILVGIIAIATVVVISFLTRRSKRRRRNSFEELDDGFLSDSEPPKQKHPRHSRHSRRLRQKQHSSGIMELDVRKSIPQGVVIEGGSRRSKPHASDNQQRHSDSDSTNSTLSLDTNPMNDNRSNHPVVNDRRASTPSSDLATVSSNQVGPASPTEVGRQRLNALIRQRAALLASGNTGDKSVYNELMLLEEQIQILILRHPDASSQDTPPPYEHNS